MVLDILNAKMWNNVEFCARVMPAAGGVWENVGCRVVKIIC